MAAIVWSLSLLRNEGGVEVRKSLLNIGVSLLAMTAANAALAAAEPPAEGAFTVVVLPDTQNYADVNQPRLNHYFKTQTDWIVANRDKHDIKYVFTLGDIVQHNREDRKRTRLNSSH